MNKLDGHRRGDGVCRISTTRFASKQHHDWPQSLTAGFDGVTHRFAQPSRAIVVRREVTLESFFDDLPELTKHQTSLPRRYRPFHSSVNDRSFSAGNKTVKHEVHELRLFSEIP